MARKKISTTIYVTPEQNDELKLLHARTKVPIAVYIREGIDLVLSRYNHLLPGQLALVPPVAPALQSGPASGIPMPVPSGAPAAPAPLAPTSPPLPPAAIDHAAVAGGKK